MQVSVENTGALRRRMSVAVPADRIEQAFESRLKRLSRQLKVPGFRPGKTPMKVLEARYGEQVLEEVAGELIQSSFREAIGQEGLKPVAGPLIRRQPLGRGKQLAYTAEFEIFPEIARLDLKGRPMERLQCQISEEDVNESIASLRRQRTAWQPVQREAREGDRLMVDFKGKVDGQAFEGGEANGFYVLLGGGRLIDGFETGLIGSQTGEERTLELRMPAAHPKPELANKPVVFEVKVREVAEPVLPEVNDELARLYGVTEGGVERLRAQVRANLERELRQRLRTAMRTRVLDALLEMNSFELPQTLLEAEIEYVRRLYQAIREQQPAAPPETAQESKAYEDTARQRLARSLILAEVVKKNGIKPAPDKLRARVQEVAQEYESPEEFVRACYATPARLREIEAAVVEEQAIDQLLTTAELTDKPVSFHELVRLGAAGG